MKFEDLKVGMHIRKIHQCIHKVTAIGDHYILMKKRQVNDTSTYYGEISLNETYLCNYSEVKPKLVLTKVFYRFSNEPKIHVYESDWLDKNGITKLYNTSGDSVVEIKRETMEVDDWTKN